MKGYVLVLVSDGLLAKWAANADDIRAHAATAAAQAGGTLTSTDPAFEPQGGGVVAVRFEMVK